jgi:glycosidase
MPYWADDAFFYHVYPLGFCGAPPRNDFSTSPTPRLEQLYGWLDHLQGLGINALYLPLYAFADNHDVNRVASNLTNPAHLYPLYTLLLTMPGVPSIYYGSERGIAGQRVNGSDAPLRPSLDLNALLTTARIPTCRR